MHLQNCGITDQGAALFADVLRSNPHLRVLDLEYNKITNDGATALAEGLKDNTGLVELRLLGQPCHFGDRCLATFIEMFNVCILVGKCVQDAIERRGEGDCSYARHL